MQRMSWRCPTSIVLPFEPCYFLNSSESFYRTQETSMCRNIRTLANFEPPATDEEIRASALQFVRKVSGATKPSRANEDAFNQAVEEVTTAASKLVRSLHTHAPP